MVRDVIKRRRTSNVSARGRRQAEALARLAQELADTLDVSEVAQRVVEAVLPFFGARSAGLRLMRPDGSLEGVAWSGAARNVFAPGHILAPGQGLLGMVAAGGKPAWSGNLLEDPRLTYPADARRRLAAAGIGASLGVPLRAKGKTIGVLVVDHGQERTYRKDQVRLLQAFGDQAALALENARLYGKSQEGLEATRRQHAAAQALLEVSQALARTLELDALLDLIVEKALAVTGADACSIARLTPAGDLEDVRITGFPQAFRVGAVFPRGEGTTGRCVLRREPVWRRDIFEDEAVYTPANRAQAQAGGVRGAVAVPIFTSDRLYGVLFIGRHHPHDHTTDEIAFAAALAAHAGIAIENARLYADAERRRREAELASRAKAEALEQSRQAADRTQALLEVGQLLSRTLDLEQILDAIVKKVLAATGADSCGISRLLPTGDLEYLRIKGFSGAFERGTIFPRGEGLIGRCLEARRTVWRRDLFADPTVTYGTDTRARVEAAGARGALAVPIGTPERPFGGLFIGHRTPHDHTPEEIAFAESLAAQAGIAIANARLYEETQQQAQEASALAEIARALSESLDLDRVLDLIVHGVQQLLRVPCVGVMTLDEERQELAYVRGAGLSAERLALRLPVGEGISGRAVQQKAPAQSRNLFEDPGYLATSPIRAEGLHSLLSVPLMVRGRALGVLIAFRFEKHDFGPAEVQLLSRFADQAALALENSRLYGEAERRRRAAEAVNRVGQLVTAALDLHTVTDAISRAVVELLDAPLARVFVSDPEQGTLAVAAAAGDPELVGSDPVPRSGRAGLTEAAFASGAAEYACPIRDDPRYREPEWAARHGLQMALALPLWAGGQKVGVLSLHRREARPLSGEEFQVLSTFAGQAAIAIQNARLYTQAREALRDLEALYEAGQAVTESLDLKETLGRIAETARTHSGADRALVWLVDSSDGSLRAGIGVGPGAEAFVGICVPADSEGTGARAIRERRVIAVEDTAHFAGVNRSLSERFGNAALVAVPLQVQQAVPGVLICGYNRPRRFAPAELERLTGLGRHAAIALEHARLYAEAEQRRREAEEALAQVKTLQGLLPICSYCKKVRNDKNYWQQIEAYVAEHSAAEFSHSICPECYETTVRPMLARMQRSAREGS